MPRIENEVSHDPATNTTTITVTRRNGKTYAVLVDYDAYRAILLDFHLHVKPSRSGRNEFYPATYLDGKLVYLHRLMGEGWLMSAPEGKTTIDHKNRSGLDCRMNNLRAADMQDQANNKRKRTA